jgi:eukaryotic-like serine/threonine-protein kinase
MTEASIFAAALEKTTDQERAAYLAEACAGNAKLRRRVEALLHAHAQSDEILDAALPTVDEAPLTERPGMRIGPYRLMEQIGEGGFGLVFVAEQTEPVRRKVALKVLKPGMDSAQVIARFEAERQALALMDHPNIARVLDAGATDSGRPYFVMELVKGIPITQYCDENQLTPRERLALFVSVCQAVQHAHQKGIIHRDLKPSNVLVTSHDGKPVAKVIDFGIAKAIHQQLTERTLYTNLTQMIGTPLYMSPEQAGMSGLDIDTRSDIYSLGVLLYELLTGTTPLEQKRFAQAAYEEIRRLIREEEPPRPSQRLSTSETLPSIAANRKMEPARLTRLLRGELDWIVMKCLEKDRTRRYETASSLARDVEHYLADEFVEARPPSLGYRLQKLARKHRAALGTAAALTLLLVGGVAASLWQAHKALEREAETQAVLNFVDEKIFAATRPEGLQWGAGGEISLRRAADAAVPYLATSFHDQPRIEARLRMTVANLYLGLGDEKNAAEQFAAARKLYAQHLGPDHPDTLASMQLLADCYRELDRQDEAIELHEETLKLRTAKLGPNHPDTLLSLLGVADSYFASGRNEEALPIHKEALRRHQEQLGPTHLHTLWCMQGLAETYGGLGRHQESLELLRRALALYKETVGDTHFGTLDTMNSIAHQLSALDRQKEAIDLFQETLRLEREKLGPDHPRPVDCMNGLAWLLLMASDEKLRDPPQAIKLAKKSAELEPTHAVPRFLLGIGHYRIGEWKGAIADLEKAIDLLGDRTRVGSSASLEAQACFFIAMAHWRMGEKEIAREWFAKAEKGKDTWTANDNFLKRCRAEAVTVLGLQKHR